MSTLISMVGQQPAAVATTAKTLKEQADLKQIFLLPTEKTKKEYSSLWRYLHDELRFPGEMIKELVIAEDVSRSDGNDLVWNVIKNILDKPDLSQPVYFDISPGLNYQVALISYHLKNDHRFQAIYADNRKLHNLTNPGGWELSHIGFKQLLKLYELKEKNGKEPAGPGEIAEDVTITGGKQTLLLEYACERHGRFYGLYKIARQSETKEENHRIKQEARKIENILKTHNLLNNLHIELTVCVNDKTVLQRLKAYGIKTLYFKDNSDKNIQNEWAGLIDARPWGEKPQQNVPVMKASENHVVKPEKPQWSGRNLMVVLGADPSVTMKAIFTHKPKELIILWDNQSPWISALAERLRQFSEEIPAEKITFYPWSFIHEGNLSEHMAIKDDLSEFIVNISPGTKFDSWRLSRLDVMDIYSLDNKKREAVSILRREKEQSYQYAMPPIIFAAAIHQGKLSHEDLSFADKGWSIKGDFSAFNKREYAGVDKDKLSAKREFLQALIMIALKSVPISFDKAHIKHTSPWDKGKKIFLDPSNYILCRDVDLQNNTLTFEVCRNGKNLTGTVKAKPEGGFWIEEAVAGAFLMAGGKKIKDIRVGVKWPWLGQSQKKSDIHRTEIDIVMIWKDHYICISCKTGIKKDNGEQILFETTNEIMAEARAGFGRFAVPVIVRGGIMTGQEKKVADDSLKQDGILQIGLGLLNQSNTLNSLIEEAIQTYQTTADEQ